MCTHQAQKFWKFCMDFTEKIFFWKVLEGSTLGQVSSSNLSSMPLIAQINLVGPKTLCLCEFYIHTLILWLQKKIRNFHVLPHFFGIFGCACCVQHTFLKKIHHYIFYNFTRTFFYINTFLWMSFKKYNGVIFEKKWFR